MQIKDKGRVVEFDNKSQEFRNAGRRKLTVANEYFNHFNTGATITPGLVLVQTGSGTSTYGTGLGGTNILTTDVNSGDNIKLFSVSLNWQANRQSSEQPLVFEARWQGDTLATAEYILGIHDAITDTDPIALSTTSTFTTSAPTDGAYIMYSATPTSGAAFTSGGNRHTAIGINTDTNTVVATGPAGYGVFVVATYYTYRIEVSSNGDAVYFVDNTFLGQRNQALAANVPLGVLVCCATRTTAARVLTTDYLYLGGK